MNILLIHSGADLYGASRCVLRFGPRLVRDGHAVVTVLPFDGPLRPALEAAGVRVVVDERLPLLTRDRFRNLRGFASLAVDVPAAAGRIGRLIREMKADVVDSNTATIPAAPGLAARKARIPHVFHMREFFGEFGPLWPVYRSVIAGLSARVVCVSAAVAAQFTERQRERQVRVIYDGIPAAELAPVTEDRIRRFKARWGLDGKPLIGLVGRIKMERKGQEVLVQAAALLRESHPDARFLLIGSPFPGNENHLARLQELIAELKVGSSVVYTGDADDIQAATAALDIGILASSLPEPCAAVVTEAMGFGKPVVATATGGTGEQVEDGVNGFLVPPRDSKAMADAIARLLSDAPLRARLGAAGRKRFETQFEFEPFYRRMLDLYREVTARS